MTQPTESEHLADTLRKRAEQAHYDAVCDQEFATSYLMLAARFEAQAAALEKQP